jgi:hypothetical protein
MAVFSDVAQRSLVDIDWVITLMVEAVNSSETSVIIYQTTQCYTTEVSHLHTCYHENLKSHQVTGGWRRPRNEGLHNLYTLLNIIRVIKSRMKGWEGYLSCMGEMTSAYIVFIVKREEKGPVGTCRHRWEHNINMDLKEMGYEGMDWIHVAQDRDQRLFLMNSVLNILVL